MAVIDIADDNQNKLGLVNRCLQAIGEAPLPLGIIPSEFPLGSDAQVAASIVDDVWLEIQNRGWWFNTEQNFKIDPVFLHSAIYDYKSDRYAPNQL